MAITAFELGCTLVKQAGDPIDTHTYSTDVLRPGTTVTYSVPKIWGIPGEESEVELKSLPLNRWLRQKTWTVMGTKGSPYDAVRLKDKTHLDRIANADLQYPVILAPAGSIRDSGVIDGLHRIMKAKQEGLKRIKIKQIRDWDDLDPASTSYIPQRTLERLMARNPKLAKDPVHRWRAENNIELIHREPDLAELQRIWTNWQRMSPEQRAISEAKSKELFGLTNEENYKQLLKLPQYQQPVRPTVNRDRYLPWL